MGGLQLQQLDRPLDVGQPAGAHLQRQLGVDPARHPLVLHPCLEPPDLADLVVARSADRVAQRLDQGEELLSQAGVAGNRSSAQQGLRLPDVRPALVVGRVGGQAPAERALLALRPQVRVQDQRRVGGGQGEQSPHLVCEIVGDGRRLTVGRARQRVVHEQHVRVAAVALLAAPEATHGEHAEADR